MQGEGEIAPGIKDQAIDVLIQAAGGGDEHGTNACRTEVASARQLGKCARIDQPHLGEAVNEISRGYVTAAFFKIFQEGKGDFFHRVDAAPVRDVTEGAVSAEQWVKYVLFAAQGRPRHAASAVPVLGVRLGDASVRCKNCANTRVEGSRCGLRKGELTSENK